jgi:4-hydroxy-tetrahydrodipicolinate synthase
VDGVILGGSLGEASVLSNEEKFDLVKFTIEKVDGKVPVVMNIAEGSTREAVKLAQTAEKLGAKGLMLLPPMRYKSDHRETVAYFKAVAAASSLPIMIYNNPVDYKIEVTLEMFDELAAVPSIQAVKESTRDISNVTRMFNRFGDRFKILCGVDPLAMEELLMGAQGWVAGLVCAFPAETVAIYRLIKAGRTAEALIIYRWFLPILELDIHPKLVQYIKLAETEVGIGSETVRAPRLTLVGEERQHVLKVIRDGLAHRPQLPDYKNL